MVLVIGVGTTSRATVEDVSAIIRAALRALDAAELNEIKVDAVASLDRAAINQAIESSAVEFGFSVVFLTIEELKAMNERCVTQSVKSLKQYGIMSVAEAAALAAAGENSRIAVPRFRGRNTTASVAQA